jgi:ABC-2 type transport system permease protein
MYRSQPGAAALDPEGAIQAWIFQQFLVLMVLTPVAGAMSVAAYSVIGEKQARTLEPLLATPITTFELLAAKVLGALLPAVALTCACFLAYVIGVAAVAQPGVFWILLAPRSVATLFVLGPLAALAALQLAVCVSSRVNDARSAQQIGALVVLPIGGLLVAQLFGAIQLRMPFVVGLAVALVAINALLMTAAISLFDRESILTRWR